MIEIFIIELINHFKFGRDYSRDELRFVFSYHKLEFSYELGFTSNFQME